MFGEVLVPHPVSHNAQVQCLLRELERIFAHEVRCTNRCQSGNAGHEFHAHIRSRFACPGQPELASGLAHQLLRRLPTDPSRHRGGARNAAAALLASAERSCSASGSKPQASPAEQKAPGSLLLRAFYFLRVCERMALNTVSAGLAPAEHCKCCSCSSCLATLVHLLFTCILLLI